MGGPFEEVTLELRSEVGKGGGDSWSGEKELKALDVGKAASRTKEGGKHVCIQGLAGYIKMLVFIVMKVLVYETTKLICITW